MDEYQLHQKIEELVKEEQDLRETQGNSAELAARAAKLKGIEVQLDQCWDLLRQRQAKIHAGDSPDEAQVRSISEVEGYKQ